MIKIQKTSLCEETEASILDDASREFFKWVKRQWGTSVSRPILSKQKALALQQMINE